MKQVACVKRLSSSFVQTAALFPRRIGHVARYTPSTTSKKSRCLNEI